MVSPIFHAKINQSELTCDKVSNGEPVTLQYNGFIHNECCYCTSERLLYLIHHNWYESYSPVLVTLHTKLIYLKGKSMCNKLHWLKSQDLKPG